MSAMVKESSGSRWGAEIVTAFQNDSAATMYALSFITGAILYSKGEAQEKLERKTGNTCDDVNNIARKTASPHSPIPCAARFSQI